MLSKDLSKQEVEQDELTIVLNKHDKAYTKNHNARKKNNSMRNFWIYFSLLMVASVVLFILQWHYKGFTWQQ